MKFFKCPKNSTLKSTIFSLRSPYWKVSGSERGSGGRVAGGDGMGYSAVTGPVR